MPVMLVIDDDPLVLHRFRRDFEDFDIEVLAAETAEDGLHLLDARPCDVVMLDVQLPDLSGLDAFRRIRTLHSRVPVVFITSSAESDTAIEAMKLGAYDYLIKPLQRDQVRSLVQSALEIRRLMQIPVALETEAADQSAGDYLVGRCPAMQEVYKAIGRVASQDVTVLIEGESGTGKELVARAIYQHSRRADGPFLAINCAAIPESLLESELFGHEKGAFTGADRQRIGKFEQCSGGTLFLDEIGDMTPATQSKVLRLLQEQSFERVGGNETVRTDVRIIAATHQDLERAVAAGSFRGDLYYRLNVFGIHLPPLRERGDDLLLLLDHFLKRFSRELGKRVQSATPEVIRLLREYRWPGNVRELQSVLKHAILHTTGPSLLPDFIPDSVRNASAIPRLTLHTADEPPYAVLWDQFIEERLRSGSTNLHAEALELLERHLLTVVLQATGGNQLRAAAILGMTRGTLRNKIRTLGITIDRVVAAGQ
ncbi:MAG: sigma-54-dependent Fis family transcriptional regulator [Pirellulaceae bacterium]|nr:sigma-54-dependent Fis family transcriptional regulator [Pirellulaceae bacterium]